MSEPYLHLHASARPLGEESAELRIRRIRTDRWIAYARAEAALSAIEDLLSFPKRLRMPNLLLVGPTNNGKTMIVDKFRRDHPPTEARANRDGVANVPVLKVQMPSAPDERRFFGTILDALGMPNRPNDRIAAKQDTAVRLMRATKVRLLVIDEVHNVLSGSHSSAASSTSCVGLATSCRSRWSRLGQRKRCVRSRAMTSSPTVLSLLRYRPGVTAKNTGGC